MAGLDPAIPIIEARLCHIIEIAGSSPAMTGGGIHVTQRGFKCAVELLDLIRDALA
jgi:hypothetical protein